MQPIRRYAKTDPIQPNLSVWVSLASTLSSIGAILKQEFKILLGTYFYVIGISFDKTHFTCILVNLCRFKMITTSGKLKT